MNSVLVFSVTIYICVAAPTHEDAQAKILSYENNNAGEGNYDFSFETSNGISRKESGRLVNAGEPDEHLVVQGIYSYTDTEGHLIYVQYTADENGYRVEEVLSPVSAPLPPAAVATLLG